MTVIILALVGGVLGAALLRDFGGFAFGALVGSVAGWVSDLAGRVRLLERRLDARKAIEARDAAHPPPRTESAASRPAAVASPPRPPEPAAAHAPSARPTPPPEPIELDVPAAAMEPPRREPASASTAAARARRAAALESLEPSAIEALLTRIWRWFTTGNVPVKVGVVLSLIGVGFLVKEGIDRDWIVLPLEMRLMLVALFGIGLLGLGWRLRERQRTYALSVQGGGIGVLYLTIYASFALYDLLPAALAFGLLLAVTAAAGTLAVLQDARALAVFGTLGGFLAPVLVSTGSNDHVALFGYYAVLNVAIVGIAWFKAWRELNVLGFLFTFGIGTLWGASGYVPEKFATTEPFLVLFTLMYLLIPVLFALRTEPRLRGFVDGTLLFGTPIVAFSLQSQLVGEMGLAVSAVVLALAYVGMATFLYRLRRDELRVLVEAQLALAVAFVTVAVPLALDARWTSAAWALQGAALIWLAFRQQRTLALVAGLALQALSAVAYVEQSAAAIEWPVLNGYYLGAFVLALAGFLSARWFDSERAGWVSQRSLSDGFAKLLSISLTVWATGWWFFGGVAEIERTVAAETRLAALLVFAAGTALGATVLARRTDWTRLNWLGVTLWPSAVSLGAVALLEAAHPAENFGWLAWPVVIASMFWFLRAREEQFPRLRGALHSVVYWLGASLVLAQTHWLVDRVADGVWPAAAVLALAAVLVLATLRASAAVAWPFAAHARTYVQPISGAIVAALTLGAIAFNLESAATAVPLPYVPLMNPLELASALALFALLAWLRVLGEQNRELAAADRVRPAVAGIGAWFLVTIAVARSVHHWTGVPYDVDSLAVSTTFQSALSIVWGVAGLAGMVVGARALRRSVWLTGAGLMTVVVAKLFVVDLGNTDTLARVVSFLGVGVLLLVVGYFAPVPPRTEAMPAPSV